MHTEADPLLFEGQALYLAEGTLSEVQVARTSVNLLERLDGQVKARSLVAGAGAVLGGMHGMVANSASIALYDGEETFHFAGLLNGQVVCGTFQHADNFKEGDRVRAVVSRRGEVLFAHSMMNAATQEFYLPMNVFAGPDGLFRHCMRVALGFTVFGWVISACIALFTDILSMPKLSSTERLALVAMLVGFPPAIMFPFEYWTYRSMRGAQDTDGDSYATAIFKVFGFPRPGQIDLLRHGDLSTGAGGGWQAAWRADNLMAGSGR
jgi:hypothetical protein